MAAKVCNKNTSVKKSSMSTHLRSSRRPEMIGTWPAASSTARILCELQQSFLREGRQERRGETAWEHCLDFLNGSTREEV
jgi:hypothetical protein